MSISYNPLWQMLNEMNITKMEFAKMIGMSNATLAKLSKNEPITLTTVDKICNRFNCQIDNVVKHIHDIQVKKANFTIDKGTIVLTGDITYKTLLKVEGLNSPPMERIYKRPHIVLDIISPNMDNDPQKIATANYDDLSYLVAPIYTHTITTSLLDTDFHDVEIEGKVTSGVVAIGKASIMDSGLFEKKLGMFPQKYIEKFSNILLALENVVDIIDEE